MLGALGDLTKDPAYFQKAWDLSDRKYASAKAALGRYAFDKGDLQGAFDHLNECVAVKPLMSRVWFLLGSVSMRIDDWPRALQAFSEVVQQEPEEADAWANIAAVHLHLKNPSSAFAALNQSLRYMRNNWRVWLNKLYCCMDLSRFDEAMQACSELIDFKQKTAVGKDCYEIEEKVVRAIMHGVVSELHVAQELNDKNRVDPAVRSVDRLQKLLTKISATTKTECWVYEILVVFKEMIGEGDDAVIECLMKCHRSLTMGYNGWEKDATKFDKVVEICIKVGSLHSKLERKMSLGEKVWKQNMSKCIFMLVGVCNKVKQAFEFEGVVPESIEKLEQFVVLLREQIASK